MVMPAKASQYLGISDRAAKSETSGGAGNCEGDEEQSEDVKELTALSNWNPDMVCRGERP
jgi:hypothetical protein